MTNDTTGMDEDEVWEGLETLYRQGKIDHVPGIGSGTEPAFKLNESGVKAARDVLRENDGALGMMLQMAVSDADEGEEVKAIVAMAEKIRDDVGLNVFRRLREHSEDIPAIDFEGLPEHFYEEFDP